MRVCLVSEHADPGRGGAETYLTAAARAMARAGHEVIVLSMDVGEAWGAGVAFTRIAAPGPGPAIRAVQFARGARGALKVLAPDVSIALGKSLGAHCLWPHGGVHKASVEASLRAALASRANAIAKVLSPKQWAFEWIERAQYADVAAGRARAIALSEGVRRDMATHRGIDPAAVQVCPNGVDTERFRPAAPGERDRVRKALGLGGGPLLLFAAHHFVLKGLGPAIEALARVRGATLVVAGRGRPDAFLHLAQERKAAARVRFLGARERLDRLYRAADALLHPTFYDPCSLVTLEALASGLPVVTTRANGAGELLREGVEGFVVDDPRDVDALADRAARAVEAGAGMRERARALALRNRLEDAVARLLAAAAGDGSRA